MPTDRNASTKNRIFSNLGKIDKASSMYQHGKRGSLIASAKQNVFEFPVFISSSVQLDYATATTSLLEQVYASYLQMAISINPVVDSSMVRNGIQFSDFKSDTNRYLEYTDMSYAHDAVHNEFCIEGNMMLEFDMLSIEDADAKVINEYVNHQPLSEFDHFFQEGKYDQLKQYTNDPNTVERTVTRRWNDKTQQWEDSVISTSRHDSKHSKEMEDEEYEKIKKENTRLQQQIDNNQKEIEKTQNEINNKQTDTLLKIQQLNNMTEDRESEKKKLQQEIDKNEKDIQVKQAQLLDYEDKHQKYLNDLELSKRKEAREDAAEKRAEKKLAFDTATAPPAMIDETKIKKLNTMKPLMMNVQLSVMDDNGSISRPINYVIGVKTYNRIVDADILPEVAKYPIDEMDKITRKAKWRAGELKFFKDILFRVKQKKQTAIDSRDPKRKWYRRLYELAHMKGDAPSAAVAKGKSVTMSALRSQIDASFNTGVIPNATIIMTQADVMNIKSQTNIDLLKGSTAKKFCEELFLMGLIVLDTDSESIKMMLPDLNQEFEIHSIASVNRQLAELDTAGTKTRDMFKMLG